MIALSQDGEAQQQRLSGARRRLSPLSAPLDAGLGGGLDAGLDGGTDEAPGVPQPMAPSGPTDRTPSTPMGTDTAPANGVTGITQLSDGSGGVVAVPPPVLAPVGSLPYQTMNADGTGSQGPTPSTYTPGLPGAAGGMVDTTQPVAPNLAPGTSTFGPDSNLIASQVLPGGDARLTGLQTTLDSALGKVVNGPDRLALANQYYDAATPAMDEQYQHDLKDATTQAGAHGILGSGMLTNRYGDLFSGLERNKQASRLKYLTDAATGTIGDNLNAYQAASGAENQAYGEGVGARNEQRTERGYQQSVAEKAIAQRIAQQQAEEAANQQAFDNAARLFGLGNANNPTGAYQNASDTAAASAGQSTADIAALLRLLATRSTGGV